MSCGISFIVRQLWIGPPAGDRRRKDFRYDFFLMLSSKNKTVIKNGKIMDDVIELAIIKIYI